MNPMGLLTLVGNLIGFFLPVKDFCFFVVKKETALVHENNPP